MGPLATLVHRMEGRARFRVPQRRGDAAWFRDVERRLAQIPGVRAVRVNPQTASILLLHPGAPLDVIVATAVEQGLFRLASPGLAVQPASAHFADGLAAVDRRLHEMSGGLVDGRAVLFVGLLLAAAWQLLRGNVWPAAGSLAWYAFNTLPSTTRTDTATPLAPPATSSTVTDA